MQHAAIPPRPQDKFVWGKNFGVPTQDRWVQARKNLTEHLIYVCVFLWGCFKLRFEIKNMLQTNNQWGSLS